MAQFGEFGRCGNRCRGSGAEGEHSKGESRSTSVDAETMAAKAAPSYQRMLSTTRTAPSARTLDDEECFEAIMWSMKEISGDFQTASNSARDDHCQLSEDWFQKDAKQFDEKLQKKKQLADSRARAAPKSPHPSVSFSNGDSKMKVLTKWSQVTYNSILEGKDKPSIGRNYTSEVYPVRKSNNGFHHMRHIQYGYVKTNAVSVRHIQNPTVNELLSPRSTKSKACNALAESLRVVIVVHDIGIGFRLPETPCGLSSKCVSYQNHQI